MSKIHDKLQEYLGVKDTSETESKLKFNDNDKILNREQNISRVAYEQATKIYDSLVDIYQTLQEEPFRFVRNSETLAKLAYRIYCIQIKRDIMFNDWSLQDAQDMYPELKPAVIENLYTANIKTFVQTQIESKRDEISQRSKEIMDVLKAFPRKMSGADLRNKINYVVEGYLDVFDVKNAITFAKNVYKETTGLEPPDILAARGFVHPLLITEQTIIPVQAPRKTSNARKDPYRRLKEFKKKKFKKKKFKKDRRIENLKRVSRRYRKQLQARSPMGIAFDKFAVNVEIARAKKDTTQQTIDATLALTEFFIELQYQQDLRENIKINEEKIERLRKVIAKLNG